MNKTKITISLFVLLISLVSNIGATMAQSTTAETKDTKCVEEMKPYIKGKSTEFRTYLKEHFQSKNTNTSLLDLALKRFEVYKKDLRTKYESYAPQQGFSLYSESQDTLECSKQMNDEIKIMETLLKSYYKQTSNIKTSTAFMTKLQQINKQLDQLLLDITQMLGKWNSLENRVPCFTKQCL
ncbi:hypothetical protein C0416_04320 [bacterium]|nr:hypothetical protein [bacterium]